jgi:hypothetical protein
LAIAQKTQKTQPTQPGLCWVVWKQLSNVRLSPQQLIFAGSEHMAALIAWRLFAQLTAEANRLVKDCAKLVKMPPASLA